MIEEYNTQEIRQKIFAKMQKSKHLKQKERLLFIKQV